MIARSTAAATLVIALLAVTGPVALAVDDVAADDPIRLDISGLAPLGAGLVVAVHDAKNPDEDDRTRASLLTLTASPAGVVWAPIAVDWPADGGPSNDLESASAIPGASTVILAESGDDGSDFQRLFFIDIDPSAETGPSATISGVVDWPAPVFNVESVAVAEVDDQLVLLYAERAQGQPSTLIHSAALDPSQPTIGAPDAAAFTSPAVDGPGDRPVSAMEVGPDGTIYVASAFDSGSDDGPYSSTVWIAGWMTGGPDGPAVVIAPEPVLLATLDAFKTESLAWIEAADGTATLYAGTDDENYGGVLRPLPLD